MKKRLFLAIPIPRKIQIGLAAYKDVFPDNMHTWAHPENYHITVSFFGEQDEKIVEQVSKITEVICQETEPFTLTFQEIVLAPPLKAPSMIWAKYQSNHAFTNFVTAIECAIRENIPYADKREGHTPLPHITLARSKHLNNVQLPQISLDPVGVNTISLYESKKTEQGSVYTIHKEFPLKS